MQEETNRDFEENKWKKVRRRPEKTTTGKDIKGEVLGQVAAEVETK